MVSKRFSLAATCVLVMLAILAAGCGERPGVGSEDSGASVREKPTERSVPEKPAITAENSDRFSEDAIVLASRAVNEPRISASEAAEFDDDLRRIREEYPHMKGIHARSAFVFDEMLVSLRTGASWRERWRDGELKTDDAEVDRFLEKYGADGVEPLLPPEEDPPSEDRAKLEAFVLYFKGPLNVEALATEFETSSEKIRYAEPNGLGGDGDDIVFERSRDGSVSYAFSEGSGDCMAGCIERRTWTVMLKTNGDMSLEESVDGPGGGERRGMELSTS